MEVPSAQMEKTNVLGYFTDSYLGRVGLYDDTVFRREAY